MAAVSRASLLVALIVLAALGAEVSSGIVGRWRSLETSHGGIGAMYDFHANGVVGFSPGAIVEITYRLDGDQFVFRPLSGDQPEQKQPMKWQGENKFRVGSGDQAFELTRSGNQVDSSNRLLGEWSGT